MGETIQTRFVGKYERNQSFLYGERHQRGARFVLVQNARLHGETRSHGSSRERRLHDKKPQQESAG